MEQNHREWELAAFEGWQTYLSNFQGKGQPMDFEKYKRMMGVKPPPTFGGKSKKSEIEEARSALAKGFGNVFGSLQPPSKR